LFIKYIYGITAIGCSVCCGMLWEMASFKLGYRLVGYCLVGHQLVLGMVHDGAEELLYVCIKGLLIMLECIRGNRRDCCNPFQCEMVILNLLVNKAYNTRMNHS
jgi:hypothetical protein